MFHVAPTSDHRNTPPSLSSRHATADRLLRGRHALSSSATTHPPAQSAFPTDSMSFVLTKAGAKRSAGRSRDACRQIGVQQHCIYFIVMVTPTTMCWQLETGNKSLPDVCMQYETATAHRCVHPHKKKNKKNSVMPVLYSLCMCECNHVCSVHVCTHMQRL